jgi:hypothetical protein
VVDEETTNMLKYLGNLNQMVWVLNQSIY